MQHKKLIISILIVAAAFAGGWLVLKSRPAPEANPNEELPADPVTGFVPREIRRADLSEKGTYYHVDAFYPETENKRVNDIFISFISEQVRQFLEDTGVAVMTAEQAQELGLSPDRQYFISIDYTSNVSSIAYNYVFEISLDTGGAHPNHYSKTYSFNENGEIITLSDIFKAGVDYLTPVSKVVQADLKKREFADANWISEGAAPIADNYQNFVLKDTGIDFIFDPYQVAAYAAGTQTVTVPYANLTSVLRPEYIR